VTQAMCSPSHLNIAVLLDPQDPFRWDQMLPCTGITQGLKYDKNLSESSCCVSMYWTVWESSAASNSMALSDARTQPRYKNKVINRKAKLRKNIDLRDHFLCSPRLLCLLPSNVHHAAELHSSAQPITEHF
jgi:hypothetical protein